MSKSKRMKVTVEEDFTFEDDPEDAWDDGDPVAVRLILLGQVLVSIYEEALGGNVARAQIRKAMIRGAAERLFDQATIELSM